MSYRKEDIKAALSRDPAAINKFYTILLSSGYKAIRRHRRAHFFYKKNMKFLAFCISYFTKKKTGIDIHPAATIGKGFFIDHGQGVVIGETTIIGDNVTLYQGVTLGGTGKDTGKRHPTIMNNVMISAGAKILGPITIGKGSKIGSGSVVLKDVPEFSTVVGIPGRVVKQEGNKVGILDHEKLPDPVFDIIKTLDERIKKLENEK